MGDAAQSGHFGPNTPLVARFLTRIAHAPTLHWLDAVARWSDADEAEGETALRALTEALDASGLYDAAAHIARRVQEYADSIEWFAGRVRPDVDRELVERAGAVATQAAWALMLYALWLDADYARTLYEPWQASVPFAVLEREG
jgi:hypothetical protein